MIQLEEGWSNKYYFANNMKDGQMDRRMDCRIIQLEEVWSNKYHFGHSLQDGKMEIRFFWQQLIR